MEDDLFELSRVDVDCDTGLLDLDDPNDVDDMANGLLLPEAAAACRNPVPTLPALILLFICGALLLLLPLLLLLLLPALPPRSLTPSMMSSQLLNNKALSK